MGGWADGIKARELGTGAETETVWVGYRESARDGLTTTLSLETAMREQVWVEMDAPAWQKLIDCAQRAIQTLHEDARNAPASPETHETGRT